MPKFDYYKMRYEKKFRIRIRIYLSQRMFFFSNNIYRISFFSSSSKNKRCHRYRFVDCLNNHDTRNILLVCFGKKADFSNRLFVRRNVIVNDGNTK